MYAHKILRVRFVHRYCLEKLPDAGSLGEILTQSEVLEIERIRHSRSLWCSSGAGSTSCSVGFLVIATLLLYLNLWNSGAGVAPGLGGSSSNIQEWKCIADADNRTVLSN